MFLCGAACSTASADSIHWYVDAISPQNTIDYLVEAAPPPFPGYDLAIFTDLAERFPYDTLNAIYCYNPFADCQVGWTEAPVKTWVELPPAGVTQQPAAHVPEPATWWLGLAALVMGAGATVVRKGEGGQG